MALPLPSPQSGEAAVVGLGKSGAAAAYLLRARGYAVYASDASDSVGVAQREGLANAGATVDVGHHDLERIARASFVVVSPGIPPTAPPLAAARKAEREIMSEIELALRLAPGLHYVAVTGTNGKTTTTALVGHLLRALGTDAPDAGNIGTPLAAVVDGPDIPAWAALELSSFQLHDTPSVDPAVGVLTNLSADHLDRYASVEEYFADKAMLFRNATPGSRWVLNADDRASLDLVREIPGERRFFSVREQADAWYDRANGELVVLGAPVTPRDALALLGDHNVANALAASLAVMLAAPEFRTPAAREVIGSALASFRALSHRLELVGEYGGVQWINDSKATNVGSTYVAVAGMTRPTILLLGGRHKGEPYTALADEIRKHVKHVIAYGEAGPIVQHDLAGVVPLDLVTGDFESVIGHARSLAKPGDAILLSPACSSYDMFNNYIERGERFRALAGQG
jgi:UDP-N-acetylmuramoylalanine--D-glutamate ligase